MRGCLDNRLIFVVLLLNVKIVKSKWDLNKWNGNCPTESCPAEELRGLDKYVMCRPMGNRLANYYGTRSKTFDGTECEKWSAHSDKSIATMAATYTYKRSFLFGPNDSGKLADLKNYCRNPDLTLSGPWCIVKDGNAFNRKPCFKTCRAEMGSKLCLGRIAFEEKQDSGLQLISQTLHLLAAPSKLPNLGRRVTVHGQMKEQRCFVHSIRYQILGPWTYSNKEHTEENLMADWTDRDTRDAAAHGFAGQNTFWTPCATACEDTGMKCWPKSNTKERAYKYSGGKTTSRSDKKCMVLADAVHIAHREIVEKGTQNLDKSFEELLKLLVSQHEDYFMPMMKMNVMKYLDYSGCINFAVFLKARRNVRPGGFLKEMLGDGPGCFVKNGTGSDLFWYEPCFHECDCGAPMDPPSFQFDMCRNDQTDGYDTCNGVERVTEVIVEDKLFLRGRRLPKEIQSGPPALSYGKSHLVIASALGASSLLAYLVLLVV